MPRVDQLFRSLARKGKSKIEETASGRSNLKGAPPRKKPNAMNHVSKEDGDDYGQRGTGNAMRAGR